MMELEGKQRPRQLEEERLITSGSKNLELWGN